MPTLTAKSHKKMRLQLMLQSHCTKTITLENIYKILLNFSELFDIIDEDEQKNLLTYLIKEIQLNPHWENKSPLKRIEFNFPIYRNGEEVRKFLCEGNPNVETLVCLKRK